jgi:pSer/pThr/pTyr-binding forkhead associated (FHA) protein
LVGVAAAVRAITFAAMSSPPFLLFADPHGRPRTVELEGRRCTIGRRASCDLPLLWDAQVSRLHAELVQMGSDWVLCDEGLSRNGTYVNGERLRGRRRLRTGDVVAVGGTRIEFCTDPGRSTSPPTESGSEPRTPVVLTPAQRRILEVLCRPLGAGGAAPASNPEIAAELYLSVDTVKGTMTTLFERFGVDQLPQNAKRAELAARARLLL